MRTIKNIHIDTYGNLILDPQKYYYNKGKEEYWWNYDKEEVVECIWGHKIINGDRFTNLLLNIIVKYGNIKKRFEDNKRWKEQDKAINGFKMFKTAGNVKCTPEYMCDKPTPEHHTWHDESPDNII